MTTDKKLPYSLEVRYTKSTFGDLKTFPTEECSLLGESLRTVQWQQIDTEYGRAYKVGSSVFPSVTTMIGFSDREFFDKWREKNPRESRRTRNRGEKLHKLIETYIEDGKASRPCKCRDDYDPNVIDMFLGIKKYLDERLGKVYELEQFLYSETIGTAGRTDCIAEYNNKLSIIDFKGANKELYEDSLFKYFLQAACYSFMLKELTGLDARQLVILCADETGVTREYTLDRDSYDFMSVLHQKVKEFTEVVGVRTDQQPQSSP